MDFYYHVFEQLKQNKLKTDRRCYSEIMSKWIKDSSEWKEMCSYQAASAKTNVTDWKKLVILSRIRNSRVKVSDSY